MIIKLIKLSITCMKLVGYAMYYSVLAIYMFFAVTTRFIYDLGKSIK